MLGDKYIVPTTRGHMEWTVQPWGVIMRERVYAQGYMTERIRLPWGVLDRMLETR